MQDPFPDATPLPAAHDRAIREAFAAHPRVLPTEEGQWFRHIGIYAYRAAFLHDFVTWPPAPAERLEQLEQLRALHHGRAIHVAVAGQRVPAGVDTAEDLARLRTLLTSATAGEG